MHNSNDAQAPASHSNHEKLLELDREFAEYFIQQLPLELEKLKHICEQNDHSALKFQAHKMAPTLKMMNGEKAAKTLKTLSKFEGPVEQAAEIAARAILEVETALEALKHKQTG